MTNIAKNTTQTFPYPKGQEPDPSVTDGVEGEYRFLLGRPGNKTLMAICMNPAGAWTDRCDSTVRRVIETSIALGYDGWLVANVYPEYAANASELGPYDAALSHRNVEAIRGALKKYGITEVWAAWGNLEYQALRRGVCDVLSALDSDDISKFTFWPLLASGDPGHPSRKSHPVLADKRYF